jgi:hypothetical protein
VCEEVTIERKTKRYFRKRALESIAPYIVGRRKKRRALEGVAIRRIRGRRRKREKMCCYSKKRKIWKN